MKNEEEFLKKMENLQVPEIDPSGHAEKVKMTIMNAERSAVLGIWLIVVPCYFLFCVFMYYFSHIRLGWFGAMFKAMEGLEHTRYIDLLGPILLIILPIVCIIINGLAITHVSTQKFEGKARQYQLTIKPRLWNVLLILVSLAIVLAFIAYVMAENISVSN